MPLDDIPQLDEVDDVLDGLSTPTSLEVYEAILPYENDMVAAAIARVAKAGGGGGDPATDIDVKGFRSINAYGATQGGSAAANTTAINLAKTALIADGGGTLYFPPGTTAATQGLVANDGVDWRGSQRGASILHFPTDTAAGTWAIVHAAADGSRRPNFFDMTILGPGTTQVHGVASATMRGIKLAYKSVMERVAIKQFYAGVSLYGDHNYFLDVDIEACHWGVELPESGILAKGNHSFVNCDFTANTLCGIHVAGGNTLDGCTFIGSHFGFGPFGILREDYASGTAANAAFMMENAFYRCAWEYIGNSAIADLGTDNGQQSWLHNTMDSSGFSWGNPSNTATSNDLHGVPFPRDYTFQLPGPCIGGYIQNDVYPFGAGAVGVYNLGTATASLSFGTSRGVRVIGDLDQNGNPLVSSVSMFGPAANTNYGHTWESDDGSRRYRRVIAGGTITSGDLLQHGSDDNHFVRAAGPYPVGVAYQSATVNQVILIREFSGHIEVLCEVVGAANVPLAQKTGRMEVLGLASAYPANPVVAISAAAGGNAGATVRVDARAVAGGGGIAATLFDAHTILKADSDDTPAALTMGASTILARLAAGNIKAASVAEIVTLLGPSLPGYQFDYVAQATPLTVTATTEATADVFITGNAVTYDGSTVIRVEFYIPYVGLGAGDLIPVALLYDGSNSIGKIAAWQSTVGGGATVAPGGVYSRVITPTAAAHTYSIRGAKVAGSTAVTFTCGAGGVNTYMPAFIRIVRV